LPAGWTGKSNACATGARLSYGDLLVFLDADVVLRDDALDSVVATWADTGGLLSVQPHHRTARPFESLSVLFNIVAVMGLGMGSLLPPREQWGAAGPCMVASRADYDRVGGHASVIGEVAEDLALADGFRRAGLSVHCYGGHDQLWFRMYRNGHDLFQGWAKNVATGARHTPLLRGAAVAVWVTALASMALALASRPTGPLGWTTFALIYLLGAVQVHMLGARVGRFRLAGLVWPALVVGFLVIFGVSLIRTAVLRRVTWSGRSISLQRQG
jgi:4,4'-diaponeurosporenoate glycosyltransferase